MQTIPTSPCPILMLAILLTSRHYWDMAPWHERMVSCICSISLSELRASALPRPSAIAEILGMVLDISSHEQLSSSLICFKVASSSSVHGFRFFAGFDLPRRLEGTIVLWKVWGFGRFLNLIWKGINSRELSSNGDSNNYIRLGRNIYVF